MAAAAYCRLLPRPIENIWALIARLVSDMHPGTTDELNEAIQVSWDSILQSLVDSYVRSFRVRLEFCKKFKGKFCPGGSKTHRNAGP